MKMERLLINLRNGNTFLDTFSGTSKVRTFLLAIILLIVTWDMRLLLLGLVLGIIGLISVKPNWRLMKNASLLVIGLNLFNIFLIWLVSPDYGAVMIGQSTILWRINGYFVISMETLWYFAVRLLKFLDSFLVTMVFVQCITPSQMASGLASLKVPYKVCTIISIAFRYIPDIAKDFENIKVSMQSRGIELDRKKSAFFKRMKQYVLILVPLIITSFDRVGIIANAMDLRGFGREKTKTFYVEHPPLKKDRMMVWIDLGLLLCIIGIVYLRISGKIPEIWYPFLKGGRII